MRYQCLTSACAAALWLSAASPASAQSAFEADRTRAAAVKWEIAYQALSALDAAQTIYALEKGNAVESNPLWGKKPSAATIIGVKAGFGLMHYLLFREINKRDPKTALRVAQISFALQGTVVALNARFTF